MGFISSKASKIASGGGGGTGGGGANTTLNGSLFEERTSIENKLLENKFIRKEIDTKTKNKKGYYFEYIDNNYKVEEL